MQYEQLTSFDTMELACSWLRKKSDRRSVLTGSASYSCSQRLDSPASHICQRQTLSVSAGHPLIKWLLCTMKLVAYVVTCNTRARRGNVEKSGCVSIVGTFSLLRGNHSAAAGIPATA